MVSSVFGEQPSAAKWNILGTNDAGFKDGTNIDAGAITPAKRSGGFSAGSLNANSSPVAVSGLGYKPKRIRFWHNYTSNVATLFLDGVSIDNGGAGIHLVFAGGTNGSDVSALSSSTDSIIVRTAADTTDVVGKVTTFGDDGFTVTFTTTANRNIFWEALG